MLTVFYSQKRNFFPLFGGCRTLATALSLAAVLLCPSSVLSQENNNQVSVEELVIPDIFPDSALPAEERNARERLRYLETLKKILRPEERIITEKSEEEVPVILESSLEKRFNSIEEVIAYLRFIAFSLENPDETDQIIDGLVRTHLSLDNPEDAVKERERIRSSYWQIRAGNHVASHFVNNNEIEKAGNILLNNLQLVQRETIELSRAPLLGQTIDENTVKDLDALLFETIMLLTDTGDTLNLFRGINMISAPKTRVNTIFSYVSRVFENRANRPELPSTSDIVVMNALEDVFESLKRTQHPLHGSIEHYVTLASLFRDVSAFDDASEILRYARDVVIPEKPVAQRDPLWISLVEPFIFNDNLADAMLSTRYISTEIDRAVGMVTLGKSIGRKKDEEFAIPLLIYAADIADATRDENVKNRIIGEIIEAQSVIGRFTDAYISILKLDDVDARYQAFATMGQALIQRGRHEDAYRLINEQVPYIDMRAPILAGIARYFAERENYPQTKKIILDALKAPAGFQNSTFGLSAESLRAVMDAQTDVGKPEDDDEVFSSIRDLVLSTNDSFLQIATLLDLANRQIDRRRFTQASRLINTAWRIIVSRKNEDFFPQAIERMIQVQLRMQDLLNAFDAAVLLPSPDENDNIGDTRYGLTHTKYRALNLVSKAAVGIGQIETAFRAANAIDNSAARTYALSFIPVYISEQIKKNKSRKLLSPSQQENTLDFLDPSYIKS